MEAGGIQLADGGWLIPSEDGTAGKDEFYRYIKSLSQLTLVHMQQFFPENLNFTMKHVSGKHNVTP